jgi:predicted translin family RNA/ssDNA-binding protein
MLTAKQEHIMADDKLTNILAWCKREREYLQMQREMLRSGTFRIFRLEGDSSVDESQKSIETLTNNIAELDLVLADYAKRPSDG